MTEWQPPPPSPSRHGPPERDSDGTTLFNRLKKSAQGPSWSHFKNL
ncbi:hypothetical protein ABT115_20490 [Streptomyces sp. NPDC001832]